MSVGLPSLIGEESCTLAKNLSPFSIVAIRDPLEVVLVAVLSLVPVPVSAVIFIPLINVSAPHVHELLSSP
jgi:hypothetical protein